MGPTGAPTVRCQIELMQRNFQIKSILHRMLIGSAWRNGWQQSALRNPRWLCMCHELRINRLAHPGGLGALSAPWYGRGPPGPPYGLPGGLGPPAPGGACGGRGMPGAPPMPGP